MSASSDRDPIAGCNSACAAAADPSALVAPNNPPGQPALRYRLATQSTFLRRMLAALPAAQVDGARPLARLKSRVTADYSIALLDAWAMVGDVLTFYQERIANEGFLGTATERRSVLELARAAGHELVPGVSAAVYLAFTVEDNPSTGGIAKVPTATQVQSIPGPTQRAQTFETTADFEVRAQWNELRPRLTLRPELALPAATDPLPAFVTAAGDQVKLPCLYLLGTSLNLKAGDLLLLVEEYQSADLPPQLVRTCRVVNIYRVLVEAAAGRTRVDLQPTVPAAALDVLKPVQSPKHGQLNVALHDLTGEDVRKGILGQFWSEQELDSQITLQGWNPEELRRRVAAEQRNQATTSNVTVYAFRQRVAFFGHNQPSTLYPSIKPTKLSDQEWTDFVNQQLGKDRSIFHPFAETAWPAGASAFLERLLPEVTAGSWMVLSESGKGLGQPTRQAFKIDQVIEASVSDANFSARATGLKFDLKGITPASNSPWNFRTTTAFVQSEALQLAPLPVTAAIRAGDTQLMLDRLVLGLAPGQPVWLRGEVLDSPGVSADELVTLSEVVHSDGYTLLNFLSPLQRGYTRSSVVLNANVVVASHGESGPREVLGSGDATQANQRFVLKRSGLAFAPAPTQSGISSGLTVLVNGISWTEVPTLYGQSPSARCFTLRTSDDGTTEVEFGDGHNGARLPTGRDNLQVTYRTADTAAGGVAAGSVTLLRTHPLGVRSVVNPLAATGQAGPETLTQARRSAPLQTQIIDRLVTLDDYQRFAAAFAGITKARADLLADSLSRVVYLSIADSSGNDIAAPIAQNLIRAAAAMSDPFQRIQAGSSAPLFFRVRAELILAPDADQRVFTAAAQALREAFSFGQRDFAQDVAASEVIHVLQRVPGVVAALLNELYILGSADSGVKPRLLARAASATLPQGKVVLHPAELLLVHPQEIHLSEVRS